MPLPSDIELPGFQAPVTAVTPERARRLIEHLHRVTGELQSGPAAPPVETPLAPDPSWSLAPCARCGGYCCRNGREHAYLDVDAMREIWSRLPHLPRDELIAIYAQAIPTTSLDGSCIFHAEDGCALPRNMRSRVCLDYYCAALRRTMIEPTSHATKGFRR